MQGRLSVGLVVACAALLTAGASAASATERYVSWNTGVNSGTCAVQATPCKTLTYAIGQSVATDVINAAAGTYAEKVNVNKAVTIKGAGQGTTTIGLATPGTAVVASAPGGGTVTISGVTITNGAPNAAINNAGSGLFVFTGRAVVSDTTISGNTATLGGGVIGWTGTTLTATRTTVKSNTATAASNGGGGLWVAGSATLTDSIVDANKTTGANSVGGGIYAVKAVAADTPSVTLDHTTVSNNTTVAVGAGIAANAGATVTVKNGSLLDKNATTSAVGVGGGAYAFAGSALVVNGSTVSSHTIPGGAGLAVANGATLDATGATISGNVSTLAASGGGGLFVAGTATLKDSTVDANSANPSNSTGGGLWAAAPGTVTLDHTTFSNNSAQRGGGAVAGPGATLTTKNGTVFDKNSAAFIGGGLFAAGTTTLSGGAFTANTAGFEAGGIFAGKLAAADPAPTATLQNVDVSGNSAFAAGGVAAEANATVHLTGGSLANNVTSAGAGGLFVNTGSNVDVTGTAITGNRANGGNGAGVFTAATLTLTDAVITDNNAGTLANPNLGNGGGVYTSSATAPVLTRTTLARNSAQLGGGLYAIGNATVKDSTIDANSGAAANPGSGGGVYVTGAFTVSLTDTTVSNNKAFLGGGAAVTTASTLNVSGGAFSQNSAASGNGGGLYVVGDAQVADSPFTQNTAGFQGGAIWAGKTADGDTPEVTLTASPISGSSAFVGGGAAIAVPAVLHLSDGAIKDSSAVSGGGLYVQEGASADVTTAKLTGNKANGGNGAGAYSGGKLTLTETEVAGNTVTPTANNNQTGFGGGVYSASSTAAAGVELTVRRSTIAENNARDASGVLAITKTTIDTSTLADNVSTGTYGAMLTSGALQVSASTIHGNSASAAGFGGIATAGGSAVLAGSIVAGNGRDCAGTYTDGGYNLGVTGTTCPFSAANNDVFGDPKLEALADNGGPTRTKYPKAASPAINKIPANTAGLCAPDQRGESRPKGTTCDIGSVEVAVTAPTITGPTDATFITGQAGSVAFETTGVPTPKIAAAGSLPAGVTFTDNGDGTATVQGTPAAGTAGTYQLHLVASNGVSPNASLDFTMLVIDPLEVTTTSLPGGTIGTPYSATLTAQGGVGPYHWSIDEGSLPAGLSLADDGTISGTPTGPSGTSTFTVKVTDSETQPRSTTKQLSITIERKATTIEAEPALATLNVLTLKVTLRNVKATLTDTAGNPQAGETVRFRAGGTPLCTAVTDAAGVAACPPLNGPLTMSTLLGLGYWAEFDGTAYLLPSSDHGGIVGS